MSVKTRIIGIGNPLCGDDGVGVAVIERLLERGVPAGVEVIDGGLGGLTLIDYFEDVEQVILVDAVDFGGTPGEIAELDLAAITLNDDPSLQQLHAGLAPLLALAQQLELCPNITLVAVQPAETGAGRPLTRHVRSSLEKIETAIHDLLG